MSDDQSGSMIVTRLFDNLVSNDTDDDLEAEFLDNLYILPRRSCFHMVFFFTIFEVHLGNSPLNPVLI